MSPRPISLHIGACGTTDAAIRTGLHRSVDELAVQGVGLPFPGRAANVVDLLRPLGWVAGSGFVTEPERPEVERLSAILEDAPGDRVLVTDEDLCEADRARIRLLVDAAENADLEVHVVLTLRGLTDVVPVEWQQFLKHRMRLDYPTFLERLRDRRGPWAAHFWQRQDVGEIVERWSEEVGVDRIDVLIQPHGPGEEGRPQGVEDFCRLVGVDPAPIRWPEHPGDGGWSFVQAEVYRRLNVALGRRLPDYQRDYQPAVRRPLVRGVLPRGDRPAIPLPPEHLDWLRSTARDHVGALERSGVRIHGDPATLVPDERATGPLPPLDEGEVARVAIRTLAAYSVFAHRRHADTVERYESGRLARLRSWVRRGR